MAIGKPGTSLVFDYIYFDPDEGVTFIEVKSGKASLSATQKKLKSAIEKKAVTWKEFRVDSLVDGITL